MLSPFSEISVKKSACCTMFTGFSPRYSSSIFLGHKAVLSSAAMVKDVVLNGSVLSVLCVGRSCTFKIN